MIMQRRRIFRFQRRNNIFLSIQAQLLLLSAFLTSSNSCTDAFVGMLQQARCCPSSSSSSSSSCIIPSSQHHELAVVGRSTRNPCQRRQQQQRRCLHHHLMKLFSASASSKDNQDVDDDDDFYHDDVDNNDDNNDDDDDSIPTMIKPYRNRSFAWTKRYRKLNPYDKCRQRVLQFGHRSKTDWDEATENGLLGQYVPSYPEEMYAPEWISWEEWLGLMRSFEETRNLAVNVLQLKSLDEYIVFIRSNPKRAEGLRIPVRPDLFYKNQWTGEKDFFLSK